MRDLHDWLETRRPEAPAELRERIVRALAKESGSDSAGAPGGWAPGAEAGVHAEAEAGVHEDLAARRRVDRLVRAARDRLDAARARPGRIRESAFELLVADALITYACEAALETEDPSESLEAVSEVGRRQ